MDVYVVSTAWDREGAEVIGAATDLAEAQQVADRMDGRPELRGRWDSWTKRSDFTGAAEKWERVALWKDGQMHPSLSQEIVRVSLAGMVESGELPAVLAAQVRTEAMMQPVSYATEIEEIGRQFGAP